MKGQRKHHQVIAVVRGINGGCIDHLGVRPRVSAELARGDVGDRGGVHIGDCDRGRGVQFEDLGGQLAVTRTQLQNTGLGMSPTTSNASWAKVSCWLVRVPMRSSIPMTFCLTSSETSSRSRYSSASVSNRRSSHDASGPPRGIAATAVWSSVLAVPITTSPSVYLVLPPPNKRTSSSAYDDRVRTTTELRGEILAAARAEFAQYGLAGARIDRIARAASASKERLYAHFGDKETLFRGVVAADGAEFFRAVELRPDAVPEFVGDIFDLAQNRPEHLRMITWAQLEGFPLDKPEFEGESPPDAAIAALEQARVDGHVDPWWDLANCWYCYSESGSRGLTGPTPTRRPRMRTSSQSAARPRWRRRPASSARELSPAVDEYVIE